MKTGWDICDALSLCEQYDAFAVMWLCNPKECTRVQQYKPSVTNAV